MMLNYKSFGEGEPLIILHGFLGMLDNWQAQAKMLENNYRVIIVDQRNHGHSPHSHEHNYEVMVEDLVELLDFLKIERVHLLGHSMGGKVAMKFAQHHPDQVHKLIVADIAPRYYPIHHDKIFAALNAVPLASLEKRTDAEPYLAEHIPEPGVRQFLMKSLYHPDLASFDWRFNIKALQQNLENVGEATDELEFDGETLFVRGGNSNYISDSDWVDIKVIFPNALLATIEGAGHWLHAEKPHEFSAIICEFLAD
ncbi:MAG: alpha/beta fold hydrolase [Flavobacteriales bacterium]